MADIYGSHFTYGGTLSSTYGIMIASVESERFTQVAGTIAGVTIFNKSGKRNYLIDDDYSGSPLSFDVDIVTDDGRTLSNSECRAIEKWLFNRHRYRKLYVDHLDECGLTTEDYSVETIDGEEKRLYLNCRFINASYLEYEGGIVGYRATLEADNGYWNQDAITKTINVNSTSASASSSFTIDVDTDIDDYTYPRVTIEMNSAGGEITLVNQTDNSARFTSFVDIAGGATVIIDSEYNYISDQYYLKFSKQNFPRLLDGANNFTVIGAVKSITFTYSNRRNLR